MILLDAYALVAFLGNEPAAGEVDELLRGGSCAISVVNLAEALDVASRVHGLGPEEARPVIEILVGGGDLELAVPASADAWRAAELRRTYYLRRTDELSLADCFLLATAGSGDEIATADPPVARVARAEGFGVIALPDSHGNRP